MIGLIDWKKGGAFIGLEYTLQLGGYAECSMLYDKVTQITTLKCDVDFAAICTVGETGVQVKTLLSLNQLNEARIAFKTALSLYRFAESQGNVKKPSRYLNPNKPDEALVSVTEITNFVINKWGLMNWNFRMGLEAMHKMMTEQKYMGEFDIKKAEKLAALHKLRPIDKRDAAGSVGTTIHRNIASYLKGDKVDLSVAPEWLTKTMSKFTTWAQAKHLKPLYTEQMVYHPELRYAGTLDTIAECDELTKGER